MRPPFDVYFSADIETDGPIPGKFSMLSFALVRAGSFDGEQLVRDDDNSGSFYRELRPISDRFDPETLAVSGLDRDHLKTAGDDPSEAMTAAAEWIRSVSGCGTPVLVAYPLSFDWSWLYWYFVAYSRVEPPFKYSSCLDIKTAYAVKAGVPVALSGRSKLPPELVSGRPHTHHALDDAREQADIFFNVLEWEGSE